MRSKVIFIILCLILGLSVIFNIGCYVNENKKNINGNKIEEENSYFTEMSDSRLREELFNIIKKLDIDLGELKSMNFCENSYYNNICKFDFEKGSVGIDIYNGNLRFLNVDEYIDNSINKVLTEEDLTKRALQYYDLLIKETQYEMKKSIDNGNNTKTFYWEYKLNNELTSKYNTMEISLDKSNGNIKYINILDYKITNSLEELNISKNKAEEIMKKFTMANDYNYSGNILMDVVSYNNISIDELNRSCRDEARIAWVGEIKDSLGNKGFIHIDITNGVIIGSNWSMT